MSAQFTYDEIALIQANPRFAPPLLMAAWLSAQDAHDFRYRARDIPSRAGTAQECEAQAEKFLSEYRRVWYAGLEEPLPQQEHSDA